jgi:hypothetical protein
MGKPRATKKNVTSIHRNAHGCINNGPRKVRRQIRETCRRARTDHPNNTETVITETVVSETETITEKDKRTHAPRDSGKRQRVRLLQPDHVADEDAPEDDNTVAGDRSDSRDGDDSLTDQAPVGQAVACATDATNKKRKRSPAVEGWLAAQASVDTVSVLGW